MQMSLRETLDKSNGRNNIRLNAFKNIDKISQVSEEGSRQISEFTQEQENEEDEQLSWQSFTKGKAQIQQLARTLVPQYYQYRKLLVDSAREICLEGNLSHFNYNALTLDPDAIRRSEDRLAVGPAPSPDRAGLIEKVLSERRIKKYYKNKHEINFQDQLDPEDDEKQIYKFYYDTFVGQVQQPAIQQNPKRSRISRPSDDNQILEPSNPFPDEDSFQRMKKQPQGKKMNYLKVDPSVGFQHELSFDVKNEQYFTNSKYPMEGFGIDEERQSVNSEINYDNEKMKKFLKQAGHTQGQKKQPDQLSHANNIYKNFIEQQNEQLTKQKMRVMELSQKAIRVINNQIDDEDPKHEETLEQDKLAQFRYLLGQMIEVFAVSQALKFVLKFKSYELLTRLYEHASEYYQEEITFKEPLHVKHFSQIVKAALPEQDDEGIRVIVNNLFGQDSEISYDQFLDELSPSINDREFDQLESAALGQRHGALELSVRLFGIWIEMDYFERQIRILLQQNQTIVDRFIQEVTQSATLIPAAIAEFISRNRKSKLRKLKAEIYFRKILGDKLSVSEFFRWVDSREENGNENFQEQKDEDKFEYYYHLF